MNHSKSVKNNRGRRFINLVIMAATSWGATLFPAAATAASYWEEFYLPTFYLGGDGQLRYLPFHKNYGGNVFKKNYPQANFYLGLKGNEYIGLEAGYEFSRSRTKAVSLPTQSILFGTLTEDPVKLNVIARLKGLHASVVGFFPICGYENFRLLGAIGIMNMKINLESVLMEVGTITNVPAYGGMNIKLTESKYIMRLMGGVQYMFNEFFGVRANVRWENTSKFKNISPFRLHSPDTCKAKNSVIFGLGGFVEF